MKTGILATVGLTCLILFQPALAQPDTLWINSDFQGGRVNSFFRYINSPIETNADSVLQGFRPGAGGVTTLDLVNFGPVEGVFWLMATVKNVSGKPLDLYLEVRQPHIVQLSFYRVQGNQSDLVYESGIRYNFYQRPLRHRYFDFPFHCDPGESYTILLRVYQVNSLSLPLHILTEEEVNDNNYDQNILWGYWFGFLSFCALFALIASLILRRLIFLWYFLYMLSGALYGFTELGYGFQFFFPGGSNLEAPVIIHLSVYAFMFLVKFSQGLLETRTHLPWVHRTLNGLFYFLLFFVLVGYALRQETLFRLSPYILPLLNSAMLVGLLLLAFSGIKSLFTRRAVAIFYLLAYGVLVASSVFVILNSGFGWFQYFGPNPILFSFFLEAMLLSVALVILFQRMERERRALLVKVSDQQKEMYQKYIEGIEKERSRIAGELHDDIGSRLSHVKRGIQQSAEQSSRQLDEIIRDIRLLSHDLAPPAAQVGGLMPLVEKLIADARRSSNVDIRLQRFDYVERLDPNQVQQVYRILQELINNIITHAQAHRADVQFFGYPDHLNITVEDDGVGFDVEARQAFGISQTRVRTEAVGGKIEFNSRPGKGTQVLLQIPFRS